MPAFETTATVESQGQVRISGVPFQPGTEVEILISPKRGPTEEFARVWRLVSLDMRRRLPDSSDEEICMEIDDYRAAE